MTTLVQAITPINLQEEKEKFFKDKKYNPQFKYIWTENPTIQFSRHPYIRKAIISQNGIVDVVVGLFAVTIEKEFLQKAKSIIASSKKRKKLDSDFTNFINYFE